MIPLDGIINRPTMYCRNCSYALDGLTEPRCPECDRAFVPARRRTYRTGTRERFSAIASFGVTTAVFLLHLSCGSRTIEPVVSGFPPQHAGRKLWAVDGAMIYASRKGDAANANRWLKAARQRLRQERGNGTGIGIIVVTNADDVPLPCDCRTRRRGVQYMSDIHHGLDSASRADDADESPPLRLVDQTNQQPPFISRILRTQPFVLAPGDVLDVIPLSGDACGKVRWVVSLPSLDGVDALFDVMARGAPPPMRWLRALVRPGLKKNLGRKNELVIYTAMVGAEETWSPSHRQRLVLDAIASLVGKAHAEAYRTDGPGVIRW